jgi:chromosome segregation ATPase
MTVNAMKLELYKVSSDLKQALDELESLDLPEEAIKDTLEGLTGTLEQKAIDIVAYANNLEAEAKAVKEAKQELSDRQSILEHKAKQLKKSLANILHDCKLKRVHSELYDIHVQLNPPKLNVINEALVPDEYYTEKVIRELDTTKVKSALLTNKLVPGCEITRSLGLRIR